jgi:hypothetical protein
MKTLFTLALIVQHVLVVIAFTAPTTAKSGFTTTHQPLYNQQKGGSSAELGLPCVDECALESFPNLPASVHPGVLSGQAQIDLLNHAKENGTGSVCCIYIYVFTIVHFVFWVVYCCVPRKRRIFHLGLLVRVCGYIARRERMTTTSTSRE